MNWTFIIGLIMALVAVVLLAVTTGKQMSLEDLRDAFMKRKQMELPCYFYGSMCKLDSQYCSQDTRTCADFFAKNANETTKIQACRDLLNQPDIEPGPFDVCMYFLGSLTNKNVIQTGGVTVEELISKFEGRRPMEGPCLYNGEHCRLDRQYCDETTKKCQDLFQESMTEEDKIQACQEIFQQNVTEPGPYDVCTYFLGRLPKQTVIQTGGVTVEQLISKFEERKPMEQPCIYNGEHCIIDRQHCNKTTKKCQDVFLQNTSEAEKIQICEGILQQDEPDPGPHDVCIYFLGTLPKQTGSDSSKGGYIAMGVILGIVVLAGIGFVYWKCRKRSKRLSIPLGQRAAAESRKERQDPDDTAQRHFNRE